MTQHNESMSPTEVLAVMGDAGCHCQSRARQQMSLARAAVEALVAERDALRNGPSDAKCLTIYNAVFSDVFRGAKNTAQKIATVRAALTGAGHE